MELKPEGTKVNITPELNNLEFRVPRVVGTGEASDTEQPEILSAMFNGTPIEVFVKQDNHLDEQGRVRTRVEIVVQAKSVSEMNLASIAIDFTKTKTGIWMSESYVMKSRGILSSKLSGLGRALWENSLKLVQKFADTYDTQVVDTVRKAPKLGLSSKKWDELFLPLLEKHGYTKIGENVWQHTYTQHQK